MLKKVLLVFTLLFMVFAVSACKDKDDDPVVVECGADQTLVDGVCVDDEDDPVIVDPPVVTTDEFPQIMGTNYVNYLAGDFDPLEGLTASDLEDGDLTSDIVVVSNDFNKDVPGVYEVKLSVTDSDGNMNTHKVVVAVGAANYVEGVNLSQLPVSEKGKIFSALEAYALTNVTAGVPLYTSAARVMFSERVQLFSPNFNGVLGFGTAWSQFNQDDSNVLMYGSTYGNEGEYTWRGSFNTDPTNLNPWISDDSNSSDFIDLFTGGFYEFQFDASKTGFVIEPSLAELDPIPVNPDVVNGKDYSKIWQITVKDDLEWAFHPDIDTSGFAEGYEKLDASDWLWTWELALRDSWFRAISGGGDFIASGIKNAAAYSNGDVDWSEVGLRLAEGEDNVIELEFTTDKSKFEIQYMFSGATLVALNQELFEAVGGKDFYGLSPETVASSGKYIFENWTQGQFLTFVKNEKYPDADMYHYTGYQYRFIDGSDQIFAEFLAGRLDSASVPASEVEDYATDPRVKVSPDATTWRLMINGFGTEEARDAYIQDHPSIGLDETYVPEPILQYLEMKQALYYGFDRYEAAVNVVKTYLPAFTLYAPTYFLDGESGMSVRGTEEGAAILTDFGGDSNAYFPDAAKVLFKRAVDQAIKDGFYEAGTASAYTEIVLDLYYASSGNTAAQAMIAELEQQYQELFVDEDNFVKIIISVNDVAFPNNYYDYMMTGAMDLGMGGISGSLLDAPSFLDVFNDDNASGFTLNWGIDTHSPNVYVEYNNSEGTLVKEVWGYNALVLALNGNTYIKNGMEQVAWDDAGSLVMAYLDMSGEVLDVSVDGSVIAEYVLGDTLANLTAQEGFDSLTALKVLTKSGKNFVYVVAEKDSEFTLYSSAGLFTSAVDAITSHGGNGTPQMDGQITDDAGVLADAYLDSLGITTFADLVEYAEGPAELLEFYAVTWDGWSDVYAVLNIDGIYIGWLWL